jgi:hypothetical protein
LPSTSYWKPPRLVQLWRWRQYVPLKRHWTSTRLCDVISKMIVLFTVKQLWEPPTLTRALANQCGPRQLQRSLGRAPLATTYKDADLRHASQSLLRVHRDNLPRALRSESRRHSLSPPCLRITALFRAPQHLTDYCTLCLLVRLYTILTAINICYRNLRVCLFRVPEPTSHALHFYVKVTPRGQRLMEISVTSVRSKPALLVSGRLKTAPVKPVLQLANNFFFYMGS